MAMVKGIWSGGNIRIVKDVISKIIMSETTIGTAAYLWATSAGAWRYDTSKPTSATYDSAGSALTAASGANAALSDLSSVAVNTDLVSDTDSEDDLGTSSIFWANAFIDKIYLYSSTHAIDGSGGSTIVVTGGMAFGVSGTGIDVQFYGTTAGKDMLWDESRDALTLTDSAKIEFGASQDLVIYHDGTDNHIDSGTANMVINFGANTATDVIFHGANDNIHFDASADLLRLEDTFILGFGTGGSTDYDIGLAFAAAGTLSWTQKVSGTGSILKGVNGKGIDETWYSETTGDYMMWDQNGGTGNVGALVFEDSLIKIAGANVNYEIGISTDSLLFDATDHANTKIVFGSTGTNGMDIDFLGASSGDHVKFVSTGTWTYTDVPVTMTGANSSGTLLTITGIDTTGNTDTVLIDHSGDGYAINIDLNEATSDGIKVEAFTNHTVPLILLDGDTAGFLGAANVGMLTIQNDIALTSATSSALVIDVGTTKPKDAAEGYCFRIIDTSLVATTPPAYAAYIDTTANEGLGIETRAAAAKNLVLLGVQAQTDNMLHVDGSTGTGWDGANDVGMLHLNTKVLNHAGSTALFIDHAAQPITAAEGVCARFIQSTGTARTNGYLVEIGAVATGGGLHVSGGYSTFAEKITSLGWFSTPYDRTATDTGATTGTIAAGASFVQANETTGDDGDILVLPAAVAGQHLIVLNDDAAHDFALTAAAGDTINGGAAAGAVTVGEDECVFLFAIDAADWRAFKVSGNGTLATAGQSA